MTNMNIQIQLKTNRIKNIPFENYEKDFTFIVNDQEFKTSKLVSQLISPAICSVSMRTECAEEDYLYDDIGSGLLVSEVRRRRQELFESLRLYYKVFILHEDAGALLEEE